MKINIHTQHLTLSADQESLVRFKAEKLTHLADRLSDESSEIKIDLMHESSRDPHEAYVCKFTFFVPNDTLHAESRSESLENSVDEVIEKIKGQIEKYKAKVQHEL